MWTGWEVRTVVTAVVGVVESATEEGRYEGQKGQRELTGKEDHGIWTNWSESKSAGLNFGPQSSSCFHPQAKQSAQNALTWKPFAINFSLATVLPSQLDTRFENAVNTWAPCEVKSTFLHLPWQSRCHRVLWGGSVLGEISTLAFASLLGRGSVAFWSLPPALSSFTAQHRDTETVPTAI